MKKSAKRKLVLRRETLTELQKVTGGLARIGGDDPLDTDGDTFPSGGPLICFISDCNPCDTQICIAQ